MSLWARVLIGFVAVVALLVAGVSLWWKWAPVHKHSYLARDERLLAAIQPPPGARELGRSVEAVDDGACDQAFGPCFAPTRTVAYSLTVTYLVPRGMRLDAVPRWYGRRLHGWTRFAPAPAPIVLFRHGKQSIEVDAQQMFTPRREYRVTVVAR